MTTLEDLVAAAGGEVLVLHEPQESTRVAPLADGGARVTALDSVGSDPDSHVGPWAALAVVVADRAGLRRAAADLRSLGPTSSLICVLTREDRPAPLLPRPGWPPVSSFHARPLADGGAVSEVRLAGPVPAHELLQQLARHATPLRRLPPARTTPTGAASDLPLDESVLNPVGFDTAPAQGEAQLQVDGTGLRLHGDGLALTVDPHRGPGPDHVAALRPRLGVRVRWDHDPSPLTRTVAGLAMAGVPLVGRPPESARDALGAALHAELTTITDLADPLRREEHSIRLRRAAQLQHSGRSREQRAAGRSRFPSCSVVLATRRPDQLDFALRQVARQRTVDVELVLVAHGFEPDPGLVRDRLPGRAVQVLARPGDALFGGVLDAGARAASGDLVVKMDDDDWYGRDFLVDLLLARDYSGADLVGTAAEFTYLHERHRTIRTRDPGERFARVVAGGTLVLPRDLLHELGGFRRCRRFVDRQLLVAAAAAGAVTYRAHGLGYLLRRTAGGHTWDPGLDFFLDPARLVDQWSGFAPSRVLEVDPEDEPRREGAT